MVTAAASTQAPRLLTCQPIYAGGHLSGCRSKEAARAAVRYGALTTMGESTWTGTRCHEAPPSVESYKLASSEAAHP